MCQTKGRSGARFNYYIITAIFLLINGKVLANDEIPESCTGTYEQIAYEAGKASGESIVNMAWNMLNDCDQVDYFKTIVLDIVSRLTLPANVPTAVTCRYAGYISGTMKRTRAIYRECRCLCYREGEIIAQIVAKAYCDLSIALGGLAALDEYIIREPVDMCGFNYQFACDINFMFTTFTYSNSIGSCEPYTHPPYWWIWNQRSQGTL